MVQNVQLLPHYRGMSPCTVLTPTHTRVRARQRQVGCRADNAPRRSLAATILGIVRGDYGTGTFGHETVPRHCVQVSARGSHFAASAAVR